MGLNRHRERQCSKVHFIGRVPVKQRGMRTPAVVELDVTPDAGLRFADAVVGVQIHFLVLDAAPEPFDEDIVAPAPLPVHTLQDTVGGQQRDKPAVGKLAALVSVENLRPTVPRDGLLYRLDAEIGRQAVGEAPGAR